MKIIRNKVFETNSSSCHSISINSEVQVYDSIIPNKKGIIKINGGEFGRTFYRTNKILDKASYAATSTLYGLDKELLIDLIKEQTGAKKVILNINDSFNYIDHESTDNCPRDKEGLKNFIFNKNSWLFVAHDEGTPEIGFYDWLPKYLEDGTIKEIDYKYILKIPDINKEIKLLEIPDDETLKGLLLSLEIRWNETKQKYELDSHHWSSVEIYFEPFYYSKVSFKDKSFLLINEKMITHFNELKNWDKTVETKLKFISENVDNEKFCKKLFFKIEKI